MNNETDIERNVMRRVRLIRVLRLVISTVVLAILSFVAALWGIGREVWVAHVLENAPARMQDIPNFYIAAFLHTHFIVQVLTVLTLGSFIYLILELARLISDFSAPPRD
jgi:FtsH-binding integral membrane protein